MYFIAMSNHVETLEGREWDFVATLGCYETQDEAEAAAQEVRSGFRNIVGNYCEFHDVDGITFDVMDFFTQSIVASYELNAAGQCDEWHYEECHEPIGFKLV